MADELSVAVGTRLSKSEFLHTIPTVTDLVTVAASPAAALEKNVSVTTSDVALSTTGITTLGYCYIKNLGPTNYMEFGPESGGAIIPAIKLKAGEHCLFRMVPGVTYRHRANTATVTMHILIYED